MGKLNLLIASILTILLPFFTFAQDTTETKEEWKWEWEWDDEEWTNWKSKSPTISIHYGISNISRKDMSRSFADNSLLELKLGYTKLKENKYTESLRNYRFTYLYLTKNSSKLPSRSISQSEVETDNWKLGFARSTGYGYKLAENSYIIPYFTSSWDWTRIDYKRPTIEIAFEDDDILYLYDETFRFGTSSETGIRVQPTSLIVLEAGYERSIVFERHLFWKWAGSGIIELAANGLLDVFIKEIFKSSPEAGPIVFLVLKSALGYGLYELRQDKMNWPFSSAPPIAFDNVKFGVSFVF